MDKNNLSELLNVSMEKLKTMVDSNTVMGKPIVIENTTIIPVSKVNFGFGTGGTELPTSKANSPFGGGSGGGVTITPIGFLVVSNGNVKLLQIRNSETTADAVINAVPEVMDLVSGFISKNKTEEND